MHAFFTRFAATRDLVPSIEDAVEILRRDHDDMLHNLGVDLKSDVDLCIPLSSLVPLEQKAKFQLVDAISGMVQQGIPYSKNSPAFQSMRLLGEITLFNLLLRDVWDTQKKRKTYSPAHPIWEMQNKLIEIDYEHIHYEGVAPIVAASWDYVNRLAQSPSYTSFYRTSAEYAKWLSTAMPIELGDARGFDMSVCMFIHCLFSGVRASIVAFGQRAPSEVDKLDRLPYKIVFDAFKTIRTESVTYSEILKHMNEYWIEDVFEMVICINFSVSYRRVKWIKSPQKTTLSKKRSKTSLHAVLMDELGRYTEKLLARMHELFYFKPIIVELSQLIVDFGFHQACYANGSLYHCLICLDEFPAPQVCTKMCTRNSSPCKEAVMCKPCHAAYTQRSNVPRCPICRE